MNCCECGTDIPKGKHIYAVHESFPYFVVCKKCKDRFDLERRIDESTEQMERDLTNQKD